jgi:hypothetical protein
MNKREMVHELVDKHGMEVKDLDFLTKDQLTHLLAEKRSSSSSTNGTGTTAPALDDAEVIEMHQRSLVHEMDPLPPGTKRFKVQFSVLVRDPATPRGEINDQPSLTEPDMHMSVQQMVDRFTHGKHTGQVVRQPMFFDIPIPNIEDITDLESYYDDIMDRGAQIKRQIDLEKEAQKEVVVEPEDPPSAAEEDEVSKTGD